MSNPVEFSVPVGTLPANFVGTLAEYTALLRDLITITPDEDWTSFQVGSTKPTSNLGPWLKTTATGGEWWVWSTTSSDYVPLTVSLPLIPNNSINASVLVDGSVTVLKLGSDVGALFVGLGGRIDSIEAVVAAGVGQMAVATKNATQSYSYFTEGSTETEVKISYSVEAYDQNGRYDPTASRYTASVAGWYWVAASVRVDVSSESAPTGILTSMIVKVSGVQTLNSEEDTAEGGGRTYAVSGAVYLGVGESLEVFFQGQLVSGSRAVVLNNDPRKSRFQCWKIA